MFWKTSHNSQLITRSSHPDFDRIKRKDVLFYRVAGWKPETVRSSHWRCSVKQGVLEKFHCKKPLLQSLFSKATVPAILLKKSPTQVLSCEICKLFKNNYFEYHLWTSTSKLYLKRDSNMGMLWIIQEHLFCRGSTNSWNWNTSAGFSLQ